MSRAAARDAKAGKASVDDGKVAVNAELDANRRFEGQPRRLHFAICRLEQHTRAVREPSVVHDDSGIDRPLSSAEVDAAPWRQQLERARGECAPAYLSARRNVLECGEPLGLTQIERVHRQTIRVAQRRAGVRGLCETSQNRRLRFTELT
jgi:hypothetical protein